LFLGHNFERKTLENRSKAENTRILDSRLVFKKEVTTDTPGLTQCK